MNVGISSVFDERIYVFSELDDVVECLARALALRDLETEEHTRRVTAMTLELARAAEIPTPELIHIRRGAMLHDIGKIGIPDSILLKPGALTDEEWIIMRRHPTYAYEMLFRIPHLHPVVDIPYCHHEKWDGTGYPRGLRNIKFRWLRASLPLWMCGMSYCQPALIAPRGR